MKSMMSVWLALAFAPFFVVSFAGAQTPVADFLDTGIVFRGPVTFEPSKTGNTDTLAGHDERCRESAQSHPSRERNVKRWRGGQMMLRWVAAGVLEAVKGFRRLKGHADMPMLVAALRARDRQLGLSVAQEERQIA